jgi:hypothetical protein
MRMLLDHAGLVVEPSGTLGIAAILEDRDRFAGRHVVTIVCGSNVDPDAYHRWVGAAPIHRVLTMARTRPARPSTKKTSPRSKPDLAPEWRNYAPRHGRPPPRQTPDITEAIRWAVT